MFVLSAADWICFCWIVYLLFCRIWLVGYVCLWWVVIICCLNVWFTFGLCFAVWIRLFGWLLCLGFIIWFNSVGCIWLRLQCSDLNVYFFFYLVWFRSGVLLLCFEIWFEVLVLKVVGLYGYIGFDCLLLRWLACWCFVVLTVDCLLVIVFSVSCFVCLWFWFMLFGLIDYGGFAVVFVSWVFGDFVCCGLLTFVCFAVDFGCFVAFAALWLYSVYDLLDRLCVMFCWL